jgi:hypothetical protein
MTHSDPEDATATSVPEPEAVPVDPGPNLSADERAILAPVLDLDLQIPAEEAAETGQSLEDPGAGTHDDTDIPDLSSHVAAYQTVLESLTQELDREEQSQADPTPGTPRPGPETSADEDRS